METRRSGRPRKSEAESASVPKTPATKKSESTGVSTRSRMSAKPKPLSKHAIVGIATAASTVFMAVSIFAYQRFHNQYFTIPKFNNFMDRMEFTLRWNFMTMLPLLLSFFQVMNVRVLTNAHDPLSGNEDLVQKGKNILTNTVEQTMFFFVNQLVLISWIPADQMFLIPLFALMFVFGRISFMIGYNISPRYRTFGFVLTFTPTIFMFICNFMFGVGLRTQLPFFGRSVVAAPRAH